MQDSPPSTKPPVLQTALLVGQTTADFADECRRAAATARLHLVVTDLASAAATVARYRPRTIIVTHEQYAVDPARLDLMAADIGARIVRVESEDLDAGELTSTFRAIAARASRADARDDVPSWESRRTGFEHRVASVAVRRLVADETLRGSLSADAYGALLDWACERSLAAASYVENRTDVAEGGKAVASLLGNIVRAGARAAEIGNVTDLLGLLEACPRHVIDRDLATTALARLALGDDPNRNAIAIGGALRAAIPESPSVRRSE